MEFDLRMQEFIELVKANETIKAIEYARKHLVKYAQENSDANLMQKVVQAMGFVGYPVA